MLAPVAGRAQAVSGSVRGRVIDERGRPLEGVLVRFENIRSGFRYAVVTDADGAYRVDFLLPSLYNVTGSKDGYAPGRIDGFQAEVAATKEIIPPPITLVSLAVSGTAGAPAGTAVRDQVVTGTTELQFHVPTDTIARLPLRGLRGFDELALLAPGVARAPETSGVRGPGVGPGVGTAGSFSVHGSRARSNNFTWDGADNNDQDVGTRRQGFLVPSPVATESVAAFEITTLLPSPAGGRTTGGTVNVVTRAGENRATGEAYGIATGRPLSARDPFDFAGPGNPEHNPFARAQIGVRGQTPIVRDRVHVFGSIERVRLSEVRDVHFAVPTVQDRVDAFRVARGRTRLGEDLLSSALIPMPNNPSGPHGGSTLTRALDASGSGWIGAAKLDGQFAMFGRDATAAVRYAGATDRARIPTVDDALASETDATSSTNNIASSLQVTLGDRTSLEARVSWGRTDVDFAEVAGSPLVFSSPQGRTGPVGRIRFDPYSPIGVDPSSFAQDRLGETTAAAGVVAMNRGDHEFRFGGEFRYARFAGRLDRGYRAEIDFASGYAFGSCDPPEAATGLVFAAAGLPANIFQTLALEPDSRLDLRSRDLAVFIEHRWKVAPNLLITAGLRYDYASPPRSDDGSLERRLSIGETDVPGFDEDDPIRAEFARTFRAYVGRLDGRSTIYDPDRNNFGPRVGVAWDPSRRGTFSIRGGYAHVHDVPLGTVVTQSRNTFPSYVTLNLGSSTLFPSLLTRNPALLPGPVVVPGSLNRLNTTVEGLPEVLGGLFFVEAGGALSFTLPARLFQTPSVHQWSLGVETLLPARSRVSARYVGSAGIRLTRLALPNGGPFTSARYRPDDGGGVAISLFGQKDRPETALGPYEEFRSDASSSYQALEVAGESSPVTGLDVRASWTWSHAIDDVSDLFATSGSSPFAQDELRRYGGPRAERASAAFDVRHRFVGTAVYTPDCEGPVWNDWSFAGMVELSTGQPFTVVTSLDANLDGVLTDRPISAEGFVTFDAGSRIVGIVPGVDPFTLVELPDRAVLLNGGLGRNTFRGRGIATVDLAVSKSFDIGRGRVELRIECFNALNRAHYALPVRVLEAPGFGVSQASSLPARLFQFGLKFSF